MQLCLGILDYSYSRGLTEDAWLPDHAGNASGDALALGLVRTAGDFSEISLRLGGYVQSVFLMREALAEAGLLAQHRAVVRNLAVNHGTMYGAFFQVARQEAGVSYSNPLPIERQYHLNADGVRLFADYFWPYYLLIDDDLEQTSMAAILSKVIEINIAIKPRMSERTARSPSKPSPACSIFRRERRSTTLRTSTPSSWRWRVIG